MVPLPQLQIPPPAPLLQEIRKLHLIPRSPWRKSRRRQVPRAARAACSRTGNGRIPDFGSVRKRKQPANLPGIRRSRRHFLIITMSQRPASSISLISSQTMKRRRWRPACLNCAACLAKTSSSSRTCRPTASPAPSMRPTSMISTVTASATTAKASASWSAWTPMTEAGGPAARGRKPWACTQRKSQTRSTTFSLKKCGRATTAQVPSTGSKMSAACIRQVLPTTRNGPSPTRMKIHRSASMIRKPPALSMTPASSPQRRSTG